jgi:hypothetical protein
MPLRPTDLAALEREGRSAAEVLRQLDLLRGPAPSVTLDRPATLGDGLLPAPTDEETLRAGRALLADPAAGLFVPASGAATRMFESLLTLAAEPGSAALDALRRRVQTGESRFTAALNVLERLEDLALARDLRAADVALDDPDAVLRALFGADGLHPERLPKGLVAFHQVGDRTETALDAHLDEAVTLGVRAAHFTVSPEHLDRFQAAAARHRGGVAVSFSVQHLATDTVSLDGTEPVRDDHGRLVFRAGGHGALLGNLARTGFGYAFLRNIDNIAQRPHREAWRAPRLILAGVLAKLVQERDAARGSVDAVCDWAATRFGRIPVGDRAAFAQDRLDAPIRVAGMVPVCGAPGGGPFWVRGDDGPALQIVEGAQIRTESPDQAAILARSTHFNPVDIAACLRTADGEPADLHRYTDPAAAFVSTKFQRGRSVRVLEHPGLWNGQMAGWNTVFVETPPESFTPVKTLADLLSPAHRGIGEPPARS